MSLLVKIKNYRAVKSAEIRLDGISVLSGLNGSGKSTIASLTYQMLSNSIRYEEIVNRDIWFKQIMPMGQALFVASNSLAGLIDKSTYSKLAFQLYPFYESNGKTDLKRLHLAIEIFQKALISIGVTELSEKKKNQLSRLCKILEPIIGEPLEINSLNRIGQMLDMRLTFIERDAYQAKADRKAGLFQKFWKASYGQGVAINTNQFNIYEETVPLLDIDNDVVTLPDSVRDVFYIDSPMALGEKRSFREHWKYLNNSLRTESIASDSLMKDGDNLGLLKGYANWEKRDNDEQFAYHRPDGKIFDLLECATGLKSFSILQMLYAAGRLNKQSLLILDEPEAHLHPQWVVEYARLIIQLHEYHGVKFLIASHSPDFIRAIKYVSEYKFKDDSNKHIHFYLAESDVPDSYEYSFKEYGLNIAPIFKLFNKSLDSIDLYSGADSSND